ncbi:MAG: FtsX-like permease family protein, partial [Gemmatimonadales bacterium]
VLDRRLLRDLKSRWAQLLTIGLVVAAGTAALVALHSTWRSLDESRAVYYETHRFGDVFASLERAPMAVAEELASVPGVVGLHVRVVESVRLPMDVEGQPPIGRVVGLPPGGEAPLNRVLVEEGRMFEEGRDDEALLLAAFAERHGIGPGDTIPVVMEGRLRNVRVTGLAGSPEYVYPAPPGDDPIPDDERFAVLWMDQEAIAPAFRMEGAFNDVVLRLAPGASEPLALDAVDRVLAPWGGRGAVGRDRQPSHYFLDMRVEQMRSLSGFVPLLFLGVAAFLLNVVLSRLVNLQRGEIATLKALGYHNREIGAYYVRFTTVVVLVGTLVGIGVGGWMGRGLTDFFGTFFRLPLLEYGVAPGTAFLALGVALLFGLVGTLTAVRRILALSPAEAMAPEAPARYRPSLPERLGAGRLVGPPGRMVLRELGRHPVRAGVSIVGIALATGVIMVGQFSSDGFEDIVDYHYRLATQEDMRVSLTGPAPERAVRELASLPGVIRAEGLRQTGVRLQVGHEARDIALVGYAPDTRLRRLMDGAGRSQRLPEGGVVLTRTLAELMGVSPGDEVEVRLREGRADLRRLEVTGTVDEMFGLQGHMRMEDVNRLLGEGPAVTQVLLQVERGSEAEVEARLAGMPAVLEVTRTEQSVARIRELTAEPQRALALIMGLFGSLIAVGVVYNNARVALSLRARDLASLRVLGFTRKEISGILLGEQAIQVLLAIPVGFLVGQGLARLLVLTLDPEEYRLPMEVSPETHALAAGVVLTAALVSALLVRRRLDRLDLIGVLKTRE